jgi:putative ABC transport system substrate-binding protein
VELVERPVASVEELRAGLRALRPGEADAFFFVADAMVNSQAGLVIDTARAKKLPTMFPDRENVVRGALANYGVSYYAFGRLSAKYVQRILLGADPGGLPVEQFDRFHFTINLKTAKALGLTIPPSLLQRADQVIECKSSRFPTVSAGREGGGGGRQFVRSAWGRVTVPGLASAARTAWSR